MLQLMIVSFSSYSEFFAQIEFLTICTTCAVYVWSTCPRIGGTPNAAMHGVCAL